MTAALIPALTAALTASLWVAFQQLLITVTLNIFYQLLLTVPSTLLLFTDDSTDLVKGKDKWKEGERGKIKIRCLNNGESGTRLWDETFNFLEDQ